MFRKNIGMIVAVFLAFAVRAQDKTQWHAFLIDSIVSVEVPYKGETKSSDRNVLWFYPGDSCFMVIQIASTETVFTAQETRKMVLDQYTGRGFDELDEKNFTVNGKEGWEFKLANNSNSLDTLKEIRYVRIIAIGKKLYFLTFSVEKSLEPFFIALKDRFFGSLKINSPLSKKSTAMHKEEKSPKRNSPLFMTLNVLVVLLSITVILIVRRKKQQQ